MTNLILGGCVAILFALLGAYSYFREKDNWNKGKCWCGQYWMISDQDVHGARQYRCNCGRKIWISWPGIDR